MGGVQMCGVGVTWVREEDWRLRSVDVSCLHLGNVTLSVKCTWRTCLRLLTQFSSWQKHLLILQAQRLL